MLDAQVILVSRLFTDAVYIKLHGKNFPKLNLTHLTN